MAIIAREAGLGVGTLYRHYPDRKALVDALKLRAITMVVNLVEDILARELTGLQSIEAFLRGTVEHGAQLFLPYHGAPGENTAEFDRLDRRLWGRIGQMVGKGVADRTLATDISSRDVIMFGSLIAVPLATVEDWPDTAGRQIVLFLRSVAGPQADPDPDLPPAGISIPD